MIKQHPNAELFDLIDRAANFILANLLWVLISIPLITLPAATAGLFAATSPWARGKPVETFRDFFSGMRQYALKASLIGLVDLVIGGWVAVNFSIFRVMGAQPIGLLSQIVTLFIALMGLMINFYVWPLLVTLDLSLRNLLITSAKLVFIHPAWSVAMLVVVVILFAVSLLLPAAVMITLSFSAAALFINWGAWRIIRHYVSDSQRAELEGRPDSL